MPTYITLISYTQEGIRNMKDSPARLEKARKAIRGVGGEMKTFYLTLGQYDAVAISEAPDDATYARAMLEIAAAGAVRSQTLRAFSESEYKSIVGELK